MSACVQTSPAVHISLVLGVVRAANRRDIQAQRFICVSLYALRLRSLACVLFGQSLFGFLVKVLEPVFDLFG